MNSRATLKDATKPFVRIDYLIDCGALGTKLVSGFAFETPGWPEFHACVRFGNRYADELFNDWIVDHFETGFAISLGHTLQHKEAAPAALAKKLDEMGKEKVRLAMEKYGL